MLGFYQELIDSNKLKVINTFYEQGADFARGSARYLFDYLKSHKKEIQTRIWMYRQLNGLSVTN